MRELINYYTLRQRLSVCLGITDERTDVQTLILACRSSARISRSSSKVKGQGHQVKNVFFNDMYHSDTAEIRKRLTQMKPTFCMG